jgi:methionyl aminopeptidase
MLQGERATGIQLKNETHLAAMRAAGRTSAECLAWVVSETRPGCTTQDLDDLVNQFAKRHGVTPAPLGYRGFPRSVCTSINEVWDACSRGWHARAEGPRPRPDERSREPPWPCASTSARSPRS